MHTQISAVMFFYPTQYTLLPSQSASCHIQSVLLWSHLCEIATFSILTLCSCHPYSYSSTFSDYGSMCSLSERSTLIQGGVQLPGKINGPGVQISLDVWTGGPSIQGVQPYSDTSLVTSVEKVKLEKVVRLSKVLMDSTKSELLTEYPQRKPLDHCYWVKS